MSFKRVAPLLMAGILLAACGGSSSTPAPAASAAASGGQIIVGLITKTKTNPFFVSFEAKTETGTVEELDFAGLRRTFEHELGHQIAFEYSKHASTARPQGALAWATAGLGDFLPNYDLVDGATGGLDALEDREQATDAEQHERNDERPEVAERSVPEVVHLVGGLA